MTCNEYMIILICGNERVAYLSDFQCYSVVLYSECDKQIGNHGDGKVLLQKQFFYFQKKRRVLLLIGALLILLNIVPWSICDSLFYEHLESVDAQLPYPYPYDPLSAFSIDIGNEISHDLHVDHPATRFAPIPGLRMIFAQGPTVDYRYRYIEAYTFREAGREDTYLVSVRRVNDWPEFIEYHYFDGELYCEAYTPNVLVPRLAEDVFWDGGQAELTRAQIDPTSYRDYYHYWSVAWKREYILSFQRKYSPIVGSVAYLPSALALSSRVNHRVFLTPYLGVYCAPTLLGAYTRLVSAMMADTQQQKPAHLMGRWYFSDAPYVKLVFHENQRVNILSRSTRLDAGYRVDEEAHILEVINEVSGLISRFSYEVYENQLILYDQIMGYKRVWLLLRDYTSMDRPIQ